MKHIARKDKLFLLERSFFTLDGLWMIKLEDATNWNTALKIDSNVWGALLEVIIRRLKNYLNLRQNSLENLLRILTFRWTAERWKFQLRIQEDGYKVVVEDCPYNSAMARNPERRSKIPLICRDMCIPFYKEVIQKYNPLISLKREKFMGLGDEVCTFLFFYRERDQKIYSRGKRDFGVRNLSEKDKFFYFERNFRTLDGLWVVETQKELGWEQTLQLDKLVWQELYKIMFRRVIKHFKIRENSLNDLVEILSFIWNCEDNTHEIKRIDKNKVIMKITKCPYIESMKRNPERRAYIPSVCEKMCSNYLIPVIKDFNAKITVSKRSSIGLGAVSCDFILECS
ncbi:MAG: hypothetical protein EU517_01000 [Promethearchaeota archaeon]|nr:MAG: hypothetical protein EU517_01000 [Candidatus Lokiarchaeota archaeon]